MKNNNSTQLQLHKPAASAAARNISCKKRFTASIEQHYIDIARQKASQQQTSTAAVIRTAIATYCEEL